MRLKSIVVGLGETGMPLWQTLDDAYPRQVRCYDARQDYAKTFSPHLKDRYEVLNICFPYGPRFVQAVKSYQALVDPRLTVIHSTVPVGTTAKIPNAVHSPILGRHGRMKEDLRTYVKWIGGKKAERAAAFFEGAKIQCERVKSSEETEALKLMCLAKYGMSIAFAFYQKKICDRYGVPFEDVLRWDRNYNDGVLPSFQRPLIVPSSDGKIGGHCVIPGTRLLNKQFPNAMLKEILRHG